METEAPTPIMQTELTLQPFALYREEGVSGVSGPGIVALGVILPSGRAVMEWVKSVASIGIYGSLEEVEAVHGDDGKTLCQLGPTATLTVEKRANSPVGSVVLDDRHQAEAELGEHLASLTHAVWVCPGCGRGPDGFMCPKRDVNQLQPHLTRGRHPTAVEFAANVEAGTQHPPCPKCGLYGEHRGPDGHVYKLNLPDIDLPGQPWQCDSCGTYEKDGEPCPRSAARLEHPKAELSVG